MIYLVIALVILIGVLGFSMRRLLLKVERYEDLSIEWDERVKACVIKMHDIDIRGAFAADDEVGWVFRDLKQLIDDLNEAYEFRN